MSSTRYTYLDAVLSYSLLSWRSTGRRVTVFLKTSVSIAGQRTCINLCTKSRRLGLGVGEGVCRRRQTPDAHLQSLHSAVERPEERPRSVMTQYGDLCLLACLPNAGTSKIAAAWT